MKHRAEVMDVILAEYNEELHIKSEKQQSYEAGEVNGRKAAILTVLETRGTVPDELRREIEEEK